ncbi:cysteine hydrolase [Acidithiobacillus ferrooxidans]|uniref:cysteine hydrolase family protein n=1 Tax=Acidithiobacillus ferrooxidans TaxID=920 RepID=UPI000AB8D126|nr:isochorismatase family cysteine hydrolase [Acidithiobacillus ferrooxidans]MCR2831609.1 cysteine hydrolase [Acidithiobacillus ferrooxidans]
MDKPGNHSKQRHRSFYYNHAEIPDLTLELERTGLLVIDMQNIYFSCSDDLGEASEWAFFRSRMKNVVVPNVVRLTGYFRERGMPVFFARIACLTADGKDRSLSQKRPGFNNILLPHNQKASQIIENIKPRENEVVVTKTTDSALTGTNLRLILHNMGIHHVVVCGIFTDQCVSSTVRSLADESFDTVVVEDACAAGTEELHNRELEIINNIYCQVLNVEELLEILEMKL